jgi:hypothetical protein
MNFRKRQSQPTPAVDLTPLTPHLSDSTSIRYPANYFGGRDSRASLDSHLDSLEYACEHSGIKQKYHHLKMQESGLVRSLASVLKVGLVLGSILLAHSGLEFWANSSVLSTLATQANSQKNTFISEVT